MKKILTLFILTIFWLFIQYSSSFAVDYGVDKTSPYYLVSKDWNTFWQFSSIINELNIPKTNFFWCSTLSNSDRKKYNAPYGTNALMCDGNWWKTYDYSNLLNALKLSNVANMVWFRWNIMKDVNFSRYYLIKTQVKITDTNKLKLNSNTWDIWYVDNNLNTKHQFVIFDPDLSNSPSKDWLETSSVFWRNADNEIPSLAVSLYALDWARISDNLLSKWIYTMEHFLGKKYENNNNWTKSWLRTKTYDNFPLYTMTYFNENTLPVQDFYRYCNQDLYFNTKSSLAKKIVWTEAKIVVPFQDSNISKKIAFRRDGICWWTSWLRVNNSSFVGSWMTDNGSLRFEYVFKEWANYLDNTWFESSIIKPFAFTTKSIASTTGGSKDTYWAIFNPKIGNNAVAISKIPNIWIIWNERFLFNTNDYKSFYQWKTVDLYFLAKVSLVNRDYKQPQSDGKWPTINNKYSESSDPYLDGFDPTDDKWYIESNHIQTTDGSYSSADKNTEEYKQIYSKDWVYNWTWQGNMYIPFTINASMYNISTPWFVVNYTKFWGKTGDDIKLQRRSWSIALNTSQWYIQTETWNLHNSKNNSTFSISSFINLDINNLFDPKNSWFLYFRNFDADAKAWTWLTNDWEYDWNLESKIYIKSAMTENWFSEFLWKGNTNSSIYWLDWFVDRGEIVQQTLECYTKYKIDNNKTWALVMDSTDNAKKCWDDSDGTRLSWNLANTNRVSDWAQQWFEWLIDTNWLNGETNFVPVTIYENINDLNASGNPNYNQINTTSNYLTNIPASTINCNINISKLITTSNSTYTSWLNANKDLSTDTSYTWFTDTSNIFNDIYDKKVDKIQWDTIYKFLFEPSLLTVTDRTNIRTAFGWDNLEKAKWLKWERWFIWYRCNSLPKDHKYSLLISNLDVKTDENGNSISQFTHKKAIISVLDNNWAWYVSDWKLDLAKSIYLQGPNWKFWNHITSWSHDITMIYSSPEESTPSWNSHLWFDTNSVISGWDSKSLDWATWWIAFKVDNLTDDGYWMLNVYIIDDNTDKIITSKRVLMEVKKDSKQLEYTSATKNEQTFNNTYNESDVWFNGTTYGMWFGITNTTTLNADVPAWKPAWWKNILILWDYTQWNSSATTFPLFTDIKTACDNDTEYNCWDTNDQQDTSQLFDVLDTKGTIKVIETKNWTSTEYIAVKWTSPQNWKFTYFINWNKDMIGIYFPSDENYFKANTTYSVELSAPTWSFTWKTLIQWITTTSKDALTIVPTAWYIYDSPAKVAIWDIWKDTLSSGSLYNNFYYRWKVKTNNNACLQELTTWTEDLYKSWNGRKVYLSEDAAQANWTTCSAWGVICLLKFRWVISDSNLHNSTSRSYSGFNELNDDQARIGRYYSLLVETVPNWNDSSTTSNNAKEKNLLINPLEMTTHIDIDANIDVKKWISFLSKEKESRFPMSMTENTSMTSKSFDSGETFWDKINIFNTDDSKWYLMNLTKTRLGLLDTLWWDEVNMFTPQRTDKKVLVRSLWWDWVGDDDKKFYTWIYWKITWDKTPSANVSVKFGTTNVPTSLQGKTCNFVVDNFPTIQQCSVSAPKISRFDMVTWDIDNLSSNDVNNFISDNDSYMNKINSCGQWSWDSNSFSIERSNYVYDNNWDPTTWLHITFRVENNSLCDTWDYTVDNWNALNIKVNIDNLSKYFWKCVATKWKSTTRRGFNYIEIRDLELSAGSYKTIEIACAFNERDPSCSDWDNNITVDVSNSMWSDSYSSSQYKKCVLPTLKFKYDAKADDWNSNNDKTKDIYTTAYPFEFSECNERIENSWEIKYEWGCWITDNWYKDFKLEWNAWSNYDDQGTWKKLIQALSASNTNWVSPTVSWNKVTWNFNNWNLNNILDSEIRWRIYIKPTDAEALRLENSQFRLIVNRPDIIHTEIDPNTDNTKSGNTYYSRKLSSAIGYNPVVTNEKISDHWLYTNPNDQYVIMHKEEIDETSKDWDKNWTWHREDVIYETKVTNPAGNNVYGLWDLEFNLDMKSKKRIFDEVDTTKANVWSNIDVSWWSWIWTDQKLSPWTNQNFKWYFKLDKTLHSTKDDDYWVAGNDLSESTWKPALTFSNGISCDYTKPFKTWKVKIIDNPIVVDSLTFTDNAPTPDWWNQHLPWDIMEFQINIKNTNIDKDFDNTFVELTFWDNSWLTDTTLKYNDLNDIFSFVWGPLWKVEPKYNAPLYDVNGWKQSCWISWNKVICYINETIPANSTYLANIKMKINVKSDFYEKLKASTSDEKYWYPIKIEEIRYWTSDLNNVWHQDGGNIVYYSSDYNYIPSWDRGWDVLVNDINDPANTVESVEPDDWNYNFFIGMPYMNIDTSVINTAIWHFSPWDILEFKTKIESKSKSYIRNPKLIQELFKNQLMDFVDVKILDLKYVADKTNFNSLNKNIDIKAANEDTDPTNDVKNYSIVKINTINDINWTKDVDVLSNNMNFYSDWPVASYFEWVADPSTETGWTLEVTAKVKIEKLKRIKRPQIWCWISEQIGCVRWVDEWANPKPDFSVWTIDLEWIEGPDNGNDEEKYFVYFPILKSILFQQKNDSYVPTPWSNNIKWIIWDPNTEVVYRVDNFIPSEYATTDTWVGKARTPMSFIRLPVWVSYTPNSAKVIQNLSDTPPYWSEEVIWDPIVTSKTEYEDNVDNWTSTYNWDIDGTDPDWELLPTPEEIQEEENWKCLYWDGLYWYCILGL